jgi:uncharacterized metal-binding protein
MSENKTCQCQCNKALNLIFSCSGAADVGAITDQAARKMTREGIGKMYCLAGVGGHVSSIMQTTEAADRILAVDGCSNNCAKKLLEKAGFRNFVHLELSGLGLEKGSSEISDENIDIVVDKGRELLKKAC